MTKFSRGVNTSRSFSDFRPMEELAFMASQRIGLNSKSSVDGLTIQFNDISFNFHMSFLHWLKGLESHLETTLGHH